jgi:hypothetical protein
MKMEETVFDPPKTMLLEKINFNIQIHILTDCRASYSFRILHHTGG